MTIEDIMKDLGLSIDDEFNVKDKNDEILLITRNDIKESNKIAVNGVEYSIEEFTLMMEGVFQGKEMPCAQYEQIGHDRDLRPLGIKPIPYVARRFLLETLEDGYSDILYSAGDDRWIVYNHEKGIREIVSPHAVHQIFARKFYEYIPEISKRQNYEVLAAQEYRLFSTINKYENENIYSLTSQEIIPFKDGVYNWKTGTFREYEKCDFIFSYIPRSFNMYYDEVHDNPREFDLFLDDILPDDNKEIYKKIIYAFLGSMIRGYNLEQWMLILISKEGGTGKGTLCRIFREVLGAENVAEVELYDLERDRHATSYILGKRMILASETETDEINSLSIIKRISGGDLVPFNPKYKKPFSKCPIGQLVITTNNVPQIDPTERAFWRRLIVIPLDKKPYTIEEYDEKLKKLLAPEELDRIANKAIRLLPETKKIKKEYHSKINNVELYDRNLQNPVFEFFSYVIIRSPDDDHGIYIEDLRELYRAYVEIEGIEGEDTDSKSFQTRFSKMLAGYCRSHHLYFEIIREKHGKQIKKKWKGIYYRRDEINLMQDLSKERLNKKFEILEKLQEESIFDIFNN